MHRHFCSRKIFPAKTNTAETASSAEHQWLLLIAGAAALLLEEGPGLTPAGLLLNGRSATTVAITDPNTVEMGPPIYCCTLVTHWPAPDSCTWFCPDLLPPSPSLSPVLASTGPTQAPDRLLLRRQHCPDSCSDSCPDSSPGLLPQLLSCLLPCSKFRFIVLRGRHAPPIITL
jgi:hypothetical protein